MMEGRRRRRLKWDEYGEVIRPEDYMVDSVVPQGMEDRRSKVRGEEGMGQRNKESSAQMDPELLGAASQGGEMAALAAEMALQEEKEWPTKCIKYIAKLEVRGRVDNGERQR